MELNKKLRYVNEHQKCNLEGYQRALERCRSELVEVRVQLGRREGEEVLDSEDQTKMRSTEHELRMVRKSIPRHHTSDTCVISIAC